MSLEVPGWLDQNSIVPVAKAVFLGIAEAEALGEQVGPCHRVPAQALSPMVVPATPAKPRKPRREKVFMVSLSLAGVVLVGRFGLWFDGSGS